MTTDAPFRHPDGSECLWDNHDQQWCQMHPLYPIRRCDRDHTPTDPEAEIKRLGEALDRVREVRDHYASPTAFPADGLVPVASVVSRLDAALATPTTPDAAAGYQCPDCAWQQKPHPAYGWQRHDERAVEVHKTQLCPARAGATTTEGDR